MSEHKVNVCWSKQGTFDHEGFERAHTAQASNQSLPMSSANTENHVDPEQALTFSLSSCHMLTFLAVAAMKRFAVDSYEDEAIGFLEKNAEGKLALTRVELRPRIVFSGERQPTTDQIDELHRISHAGCFFANSVKTEVVVATR